MIPETPPAPVAFRLNVVPAATGNAHEVRRSGPRCGRCKKRPFASVGRKASARALKRTLAVLASQHRPRQPWPGPVELEVTFGLPIPKSFLVWQREAALAGALEPTARGSGDRDNIHKALGDALEGLFYLDDCQVTRGPIRKVYAAEPGYEVQVSFRPLPPSSAVEWRAMKKRSPEETCEAIEPLVTDDDRRL